MNLAVIAGTRRGTRMGGSVKFGCDWGPTVGHMEGWVGKIWLRLGARGEAHGGVGWLNSAAIGGTRRGA